MLQVLLLYIFVFQQCSTSSTRQKAPSLQRRKSSPTKSLSAPLKSTGKTLPAPTQSDEHHTMFIPQNPGLDPRFLAIGSYGQAQQAPYIAGSFPSTSFPSSVPLSTSFPNSSPYPSSMSYSTSSFYPSSMSYSTPSSFSSPSSFQTTSFPSSGSLSGFGSSSSFSTIPAPRSTPLPLPSSILSATYNPQPVIFAPVIPTSDPKRTDIRSTSFDSTQGLLGMSSLSLVPKSTLQQPSFVGQTQPLIPRREESKERGYYCKKHIKDNPLKYHGKWEKMGVLNYDDEETRTAEIEHPKVIELFDPNWTCQQFELRNQGNLVLVSRASKENRKFTKIKDVDHRDDECGYGRGVIAEKSLRLQVRVKDGVKLAEKGTEKPVVYIRLIGLKKENIFDDYYLLFNTFHAKDYLQVLKELSEYTLPRIKSNELKKILKKEIDKVLDENGVKSRLILVGGSKDAETGAGSYIYMDLDNGKWQRGDSKSCYILLKKESLKRF